MSIASEIIRPKQGYKLHFVQTAKYKTNTLVWKMKAPLEKETVTLRALLPHVLQSNSRQFPTTTELRSYLDELYGASLYVDVAKKGEYHIMTFTMEIANEKFLSDPAPLLEKGFDLLTGILFEPNASGNAFHQSTIEKEKRTLKQRIQSVYDDKMRYSASRLIEEMCKGEPYEAEATGISEMVEEITASSLYEYYQKALNEDEIDFYVIGDIDATEVERLADNKLKLADRTPLKLSATQIKVEKVNDIIEHQDVKQGKLNIGYRTHITYADKEYFALQLFNGIFGGFAHSKLFINVREKASLAYYASSRLESHKGLLLVMSGIENENYEQAVSIIKEQMQAMKNGDFTDQELSQTKAVVRNQVLETIDVARGLVEILYHNVVAGTSISLDEWLEKTETTTKEEIIKAGERIEMDTIYFLTGMEGEK
ncbi:insulinase family protein [Peribacillus saganii]|uniref:Insulinase family protein n=1 Tax=Peribacillus saganii TaxID=2303992 RepID=A0A372LT31_9BACI|nr:pitrilysin family protein [Peribacillus saganii]RFU71349.1 insulinase family protein [Peribacillus saganii]